MSGYLLWISFHGPNTHAFQLTLWANPRFLMLQWVQVLSSFWFLHNLSSIQPSGLFLEVVVAYATSPNPHHQTKQKQQATTLDGIRKGTFKYREEELIEQLRALFGKIIT